MLKNKYSKIEELINSEVAKKIRTIPLQDSICPVHFAETIVEQDDCNKFLIGRLPTILRRNFEMHGIPLECVWDIVDGETFDNWGLLTFQRLKRSQDKHSNTL
nr:hypothetical protein [uncultured Deefgea sp.]